MWITYHVLALPHCNIVYERRTTFAGNIQHSEFVGKLFLVVDDEKWFVGFRLPHHLISEWKMFHILHTHAPYIRGVACLQFDGTA